MELFRGLYKRKQYWVISCILCTYMHFAYDGLFTKMLFFHFCTWHSCRGLIGQSGSLSAMHRIMQIHLKSLMFMSTVRVFLKLLISWGSLTQQAVEFTHSLIKQPTNIIFCTARLV